jgi:hypothetical protein
MRVHIVILVVFVVIVTSRPSETAATLGATRTDERVRLETF